MARPLNLRERDLLDRVRRGDGRPPVDPADQRDERLFLLAVLLSVALLLAGMCAAAAVFGN